MHFVAPGRAFAGFGKTPGGLRVFVKPDFLDGRIENHILAHDYAHTHQLPDHADKEEPEGQHPELSPSFPVLTHANHSPLREARCAGCFRASPQIVNNFVVA